VSHNESHYEAPGGLAAVALKQLTLRGFDPELERLLRLEARHAGLSLNQAALRLLRRGAGLGEAAPSNAVGASLDHLIGTWSEADEKQFLEATALFERVDEEFWQ